MSKSPWRIGTNDDDSLDEVFAKNVSVHLEQMSPELWWLQLTTRAGKTLTINISSANGRSHLHATAEDDHSRVCIGFDGKAKRNEQTIPRAN